jgi:hypothetical protein
MGRDGATFRLGGTAPSGARLRWAFGLAAVAVCLLAGLAALAFKPSERAVAPAPKVEIAAVAIPEPAREIAIAVEPGPSVQAKPGPRATGARVKPLPPPVVVREVAPAPAQVVQAMPPPQAEPVAIGPLPPSWWHQSPARYVEELERQLLLVPEVDLDPDYLKKSKEQIAEKAKEIVAANKDEKDAFVRKLMKERKDLAGMPFLLGKDCVLPADQSKRLAAEALEIRASLSKAVQNTARPKPPKDASAGSHEYVSDSVDRSAAENFWTTVRKQQLNRTDGVPALQQILPVENKHIRLRLVDYLSDLNKATDVEATQALVNRAIFDLDPEVRYAALAALRDRPKEQYRPALSKALQYPWLPVARNASQAVMALKVKEMIPELVALLDKFEPGAPFAAKGDDGKEKMVVRELVRVNHHRNCMLCHAPVSAALTNEEQRALRSVPVGPTPTPKEPLPPSSSTVYYTPRNGITLVRADITYLRQDFSLRQAVKDHGKWSELQRFDFLVRTRDATAKEIADRPPAAAYSQYKETIVDALIGLTGKYAAPTAEAWREVLKETNAKGMP